MNQFEDLLQKGEFEDCTKQTGPPADPNFERGRGLKKQTYHQAWNQLQVPTDRSEAKSNGLKEEFD